MVDIVTRAGKGSPLTNNEVDANFTNLAEVSGVTGEPMGHEDRTTSTISFNASTRTFTIAPVNTSFTVWCKGKKVVVSSAQTVTIPNTSGMHSIYYDANGTLSSKIGYFTFSTEAPTAYVYWNATTGAAPYFGDERHGVVLDWQTHEYLHRTRGAAIANGFLASGYTLNNSATDAATQIAIESGTFFDEDMKIDIVSTATPTAGTYQQNLLFPAKIPVLHLQGTSWVMDAPTNFPFKQGTSRPQYNSVSGGVWSTTDVGNNQHATTWILATNNLTYPVIAIIGQHATDNLGEAEAFSFADLTLTGFPSVEFRPLYKLIYKASDGYANSVNAQLVSIIDLRSISAAGSAANPATDHGNLSGLTDDDHPQYLSVDTVRGTLTAAVKASFLPSQAGNAGKFLTTDATSTSWASLTSGNITTALGFTPYNATNPAGYITGITSSNVTTALGFTPYNATNPSGFVTAAGARGAISVTGAGSYDSATGVINIVGGVTSFNTRTGAITLSSADVTTALGFTPYNSTNPNGYLTGITSTQVTTALGYTPYNSSNPSGYITGITSGMVTTALGFTPYNNSNPSGYITSSALSGYLTSASAASTYLPLSGGTLSGILTANGGIYATKIGIASSNLADQVNGAPWYGLGFSDLNFGAAQVPQFAGYFGLRIRTASTIMDFAPNGDPGNINVSGGGFKVAGNTVLHAGNYTSYSPSLTGSGASGTWAINITGTASGENLGTVTARSGYTGSAVTLANGSNRYQGHFYYDPYDPSGNHYPHFTDGGNASGVKINWRLYTGGTNSVTHYWGVDTTQFVTKLESTVRVDAPIFYERSNTNYYVDPSSSSNLLSLNLAGSGTSLALNGAGSNIAFKDADNVWTGYVGFSGNTGQLSFPGRNLTLNSGYNGTITFETGASGYNSGQILVPWGKLEVQNGSTRSPIYYDYNDTGYYVDPNSGSRLVHIFAGNVASSNDGSWNARMNLVGSSHARLDVVSNSDGIITTMYSHTGQGVGKIGTYSNHPLTLMAQGASDGGYVYSGSLRSPIFYDSDDTSYYVNPNSVTRLYSTSVYAGNEASNTGANGSTEGFILRGNYNSNTWAKKFHNYDNGSGIQLYLAETIGASAWSTIQGWGTGLGYTSRVFGSFRANETYGTIFYDADNTAYYINPTGSSQVSGSNFYFGSKGQIYDDGNFHIDGRNSPVWINSLSSEAIFLNSQTSGYTVMGNSARSPIFYDSNDTGYYLDPNSSGVALRISGAIRGDHVGWTGEHNKIQWHSSHMYFQNMNDGYWIFRKSNATEPFLLHADGWGQASGSWRAPIFYDSNDTGFYLDPQGGSRLNALSLNSVSITAGVTSLTNAPIVTQQVQVGTTNTWLPMTYQRALHNAGYITHLNTGLYKSASGWGDNVTGWYAALGGSDSSPTMEWRLTYGTYIYNSNGYVSTSGSFRSSLFYDHDDTAYYCNPNSFSQLSYANLNAAPGGRTLSLGGDETNRVYNDSARAGLVINATYYPHLYINATANNGNTSHGAVFSMTGNLSGGGYRRWGMGIANTNPDCWSWGYYDNEPNPHYGVGGGFGYTGTNSKMWLNTGGSLWTTGDMRTPIFYDSDNTGYYVNPTGGSNLNGTLVNNGGTGMTAGWNRNLLLSSTYPVLVWNSSSASYSGIGVDHSGADSRFIFWINGTSEDVTGTGTIAMRMSSGNFVTATGSFRAPIFYDSNDTTYYVDPASFTYLYGGIQNNGAHGSSTIDNRMLAGNNGAGTGVVQLRMWCSEPGVTWDWAGFGYNVLNDGGSPGGFGRVNSSFGQAYMRFGTSGDLLFYNVTTGAARYTTMQLHSTGYVTAFQSSRAPIFYDSDDTTYYADLNSTGTSIRAAGNITAYYSDMRLKTHLGKIENARDKVRQLEGFYYEANELAQSFGYKAKREVGVSAQAVQAVLPEIVTDAPINSNYLTIDYERLTPLLIEAIKEQDTELVDLRNRVAQLESLINKLIGD